MPILPAMKATLSFGLLLLLTACTPQSPSAGLPALQQAGNWNLAREAYFRSTKAPPRPYKWDGEKGEMVDVHIFSWPRKDLVLVACGETYHNTTGWDIHLALMKTNELPAYPGNLYLCPVGFDFAADWLDDSTLGIFYPRGYYPDHCDPKTGALSKSPNFQYEKQVAGINVKFIPADTVTFEAKKAAMSARELPASP
jgi:hypothetical protein